jgi:hypothetical protein
LASLPVTAAYLEGEVAVLGPDGVMRHPKFVALREDKPARQVRLERARKAGAA